MQERRKFQRTRSFLGGQVAFSNRRCTMDCVVRNVSQNGAKIVFESTLTVPGEFDFTIPHKGDSQRARIVWRSEKEMGVSFLPAERQTVVSIEAARRLRQLETERTDLQRRVAELSDPM